METFIFEAHSGIVYCLVRVIWVYRAFHLFVSVLHISGNRNLTVFNPNGPLPLLSTINRHYCLSHPPPVPPFKVKVLKQLSLGIQEVLIPGPPGIGFRTPVDTKIWGCSSLAVSPALVANMVLSICRFYIPQIPYFWSKVGWILRCRTPRYKGPTLQYHFIQGTWVSVDFGLQGGSWNQSPTDTKWERFISNCVCVYFLSPDRLYTPWQGAYLFLFDYKYLESGT